MHIFAHLPHLLHFVSSTLIFLPSIKRKLQSFANIEANIPDFNFLLILIGSFFLTKTGKFFANSSTPRSLIGSCSFGKYKMLPKDKVRLYKKY